MRPWGSLCSFSGRSLLDEGSAIHGTLLVGTIAVEPLEEAVHVKDMGTLPPDCSPSAYLLSKHKALTQGAVVAGCFAIRARTIKGNSTDPTDIILSDVPLPNGYCVPVYMTINMSPRCDTCVADP